MTKKEVDTLIQKGRFPLDAEFWYNTILGLLITISFFGGVGVLIGLQIGLENYWLYPYIAILFFSLVYRYCQDERLIVYETELTKQDNIRILEETLKGLNWEYKTYSNEIDLTTKKHILSFVKVKLIPFNNGIAYNFQYYSTTRAGKFTIFLGLRTHLKRKFEKQLNATIVLWDQGLIN